MSTDAIIYIDWDLQRGLAKNLEVHGVPTLLIYFAGNEVGRFSGMLSADGIDKTYQHPLRCTSQNEESRKINDK